MQLLPLNMAASAFFVISLLVLSSMVALAFAGNFNQDFEVTFGQERTEISENGNQLTLTLDPNSGSGFRSKNEYLFGRIDMKIKLVPGNSAGTVTTYYLRSEGANWDEIDFEFLGNTTGDPYTVHTNVFTQGQGGREQQFRVWFDPTSDFHTYSVLWNPQRIVFYVDETPIREFPNMEGQGVPFPKSQPMRIYASFWNAEDWATRGGNVKTDWSQAPFRASFRDFNVNSDQSSGFLNAQLGTTEQQRLANIQQNYMIYNYCTSAPQNHPECNTSGSGGGGSGNGDNSSGSSSSGSGGSGSGGSGNGNSSGSDSGGSGNGNSGGGR